MKRFINAISIIIGIAIIVVICYFLFRPMTPPVTPPSQTSTQGSDSGTSTTSSSGNQAFVDTLHGFSFAYPAPMTLVTPPANATITQSWRANTQTQGLVFATAVIDRSFQPKTNFSEARFTVSESSDPTAVSKCLVPENGETASGTDVINGITFTKLSFGDAGAGNYYNTTSYRTVRDARCYAVEYTAHSTNLGAYDPSQGITAFDTAAVTAPLERAVHSFVFSDTAPAPASFIGTWKGPEGTSLAITQGPSGYAMKFVMLDGPTATVGKLSHDALTFTRKDQNLSLFHGTGYDTGMSGLRTKKDCLVVMPSEGYCRD